MSAARANLDVEVVVAGHICLDVIPAMQAKKDGMGAILVPGKLVDIGAAVISTGGAVSNTGLALHRLGVGTKLMGKIGDDLFGGAILDVLRGYGQELASGMIVADGEHTSYSLVISPPNIDRIFLHCTGANDTYSADDLPVEALRGARLFHFGYPPLMRKMYEDGGTELAELLSRVKQAGLTVSLDLAKPDPESPAGLADWRSVFVKALPHVDVFLPSFEEILYMLRREEYDRLLSVHDTNDLLPFADGTLLRELSQELLDLGVSVVVLKLGEHGLYLRTTDNRTKLAAMGTGGPADVEAWLNRELLVSCFEVEVAGTTGAGDCTIAGFIAGLLKGLSPEAVLNGAVAVGASNVEHADATSGVPAWEAVQQRMAAGWGRKAVTLALPGWSRVVASSSATGRAEEGIWYGPLEAATTTTRMAES
ncbi:carbohydrate kinase family protein [Paenibacillus sp. BC26]|uniref:carbohydrate kinase family protein n=1 Tax=Paenibacillus sp. BC26 TaxID=1881032 RepID=UPI0008E77AD7|nr:carbohydrate kinase family protein [Paenibacillus sp. BC26]SFT27823.1 Sugar or nucleoside kinase, ribokinase family [Paenibacillus sp. BC26]